MSGVKREMSDQDPDYEDVAPRQIKRQRFYEEGAKEMTIRRIENIIRKQFAQEKSNKEDEILLIDERLQQARIMADRLRACIVANFYGKAGHSLPQIKPSSHTLPSIHPAVRKHLGKTPREVNVQTSTGIHDIKQERPEDTSCAASSLTDSNEPNVRDSGPQKQKETLSQCPPNQHEPMRTSRFKVKKRIIVGNVSKYIPVDKRENSDRSTHRWMVYVRGTREEPNIDHYVEKVWFFLHPSYRPHDLVEIKERPFHLTRRGWGEFPVRVQLHFKDTRNKRVDVIHQLKLDRTYTGLQTLGSETVVDIELEKDSIGLPQMDPMETSVTTLAEPLSDTVVESHTMPSKSPAVGDPQCHHENPDVKPEPDLSLVKIEPVEEEMVEAMSVTVKEEPMSPPRTVTPVKMVLGGLGSSPAHVTSPAPGTTTPVKEGAGWTRIQIKSEPNSPRASPVSKKGWQNITMLTSPVKQEPPGEGVQVKTEPGIQLLGTSLPSDLQQSKPQPASIIISQEASTPQSGQRQIIVSPTRQSHRFTSPNQPKLNQGQVMSSGQLAGISTVAGSAVRSPGLVTVQGTSHSPTLLASQVLGNSVSASPGNTTPKTSQPTVYIRCHDNQGKVYLIPQHVLNKTSSVGGTTPVTTQPRPSQVQRLSTPLGMAIIAPRVSSAPLSGSPSPGIASLVSPHRPSNPRAIFSSGVKQLQSVTAAVTTSVKSANKTATLTYVLASTAGGTTTPTVVASGPRTQKVALATQPILSQSILVSPPTPTPGTSLIVNQSTGQGSRPGTPHSRPGTPVSKPCPLSSASNLQVSQGKKMAKSMSASNLTESLRIVGSNIIGGSQKGASFVLVNQPPGTQVAAKSGGPTQAGVSLLSGLAGLKTTVSKAKGSPLEAGLTRSVPSVSLLNKTTSSPVRHLSPGTVIIKQEPKMAPTSVIRPGTVAVLAGQGNQQTPLLLVPATPQIRPNLHQPTVVMAAKTPPPPQPKPSLITTVGNQKLIVQLLPTKQAESSSQNPIDVKKESDDTVPIAEHASNKVIVSKKVKNEEDGRSTQNFKSVFGKPLLKGPDVQLSRYSTMEELVRSMVRRHPLIKKGVDRSVHPYCANSTEEFLTWKVGKCRAVEWSRASAVHKMLRAVLHDNYPEQSEDGSHHDFYSLGGEALWSKKKIMWWCRHHLYSPWDSGLLELLRKPSTPEDNTDLEHTISSCTDAADVIESLDIRAHEQTSGKTNDSDDDEIDIINSEVTAPVRVKQEPQSVDGPVVEPVYLDRGPAEDYVHSTAIQIGVKLEAVEVDPVQASGVKSYVVHEMIMAVTMNLMDDLLRKSKALQLKNKRKIDDISSLDVYNAINSLPHCDFLTNSGLGVPARSEMDTTRSHPAA